jgi:hypothetical protein
VITLAAALVGAVANPVVEIATDLALVATVADEAGGLVVLGAFVANVSGRVAVAAPVDHE